MSFLDAVLSVTILVRFSFLHERRRARQGVESAASSGDVVFLCCLRKTESIDIADCVRLLILMRERQAANLTVSFPTPTLVGFEFVEKTEHVQWSGGHFDSCVTLHVESVKA